MKAQTDIVVHHMEVYGVITTITAFNRYKITRLSGRIYDAKKRGERVVVTMRKRNGKRYACYSLAA